MKSAIILVLVIVLAYSNPVTIDVYIESLCPDCEEFITGSLQKALSAKGLN